MSAALAARRRTAQGRLFDGARRVRPVTPAAPQQGAGTDGGGSGTAGLTLAELLAGVWEGLAVAGSAVCPLCGGEMHRAPGEPDAACGGCGSRLS